MIQGLQFAWESGVRNLILETYSLIVTNWINHSERASPQATNLRQRCNALLLKDWRIEVHHVYREAN